MAIDRAAIFALSTPEKLRLIQDLWDDVAANPEDMPLRGWQKDDLVRRKAELEANPELAMSWDAVERSIRERRGRRTTA